MILINFSQVLHQSAGEDHDMGGSARQIQAGLQLHPDAGPVKGEYATKAVPRSIIGDKHLPDVAWLPEKRSSVSHSKLSGPSIPKLPGSVHQC